MIDRKKKYRTRDGLEVRIYSAGSGSGDYQRVHGAVKTPRGEWDIEWWHEDGTTSGGVLDHPRDLIEVKPEREGWVNVYPGGQSRVLLGQIQATKEEAERISVGDARIACLHIKFTEGEGL